MHRHHSKQPIGIRNAARRACAALRRLVMLDEPNLVFPQRQFSPVASEDGAVGDDFREVDFFRGFAGAGSWAGSSFGGL